LEGLQALVLGYFPRQASGFIPGGYNRANMKF